MATPTIDIAEFRCRSRKRQPAPRNVRFPQEGSALRVVADPELEEPETDTEPANPPGVLNFTAPRERHARHERAMDAPLTFHRRANLVRLDEPHVTVMPLPARGQHMSVAAGDDFDHPPAA